MFQNGLEVAPVEISLSISRYNLSKEGLLLQ